MGKTAISRKSTTGIHFGRIFTFIAVGLVAFFLLLYLGRNFIIKTVVEMGVHQATGMKVTINKLDLELFPGKLEIQGLTVYNPPGFEGTSLIQIPYIDAEFDLATLLAGNFILNTLI